MASEVDSKVDKKANPKVVRYYKTIEEIAKYYGVSKECANYLYYRAFRSKRKGDMHMPWHIRLQNALVKADKCSDIDWGGISFGQEISVLSIHGIHLEEMDNVVFRWVDQLANEWTTVDYTKKDNLSLIKRTGLIL